MLYPFLAHELHKRKALRAHWLCVILRGRTSSHSGVHESSTFVVENDIVKHTGQSCHFPCWTVLAYERLLIMYNVCVPVCIYM